MTQQHNNRAARLAVMGLAGCLAAETGVRADHEPSDVDAHGPQTWDEQKARLDAEYSWLKESRRETLGFRTLTEGGLFTLSVPIIRRVRDTGFPGAPQRRGLGEGGGLPGWERIRAELPAFELGFNEPGDAVFVRAGSMETTLGHGTLVREYRNNPVGGFDLGTAGLHAGLRAQAVGISVFMADVRRPGRVTGGRIAGRPVSWFFGEFSNFKPQGEGSFGPKELLMNAVDIGVTGVVDAEDPRGSASPGALVGRGMFSGVALEAEGGLRHERLTLALFGDVTGTARSGGPTATDRHLLGVGASVGGRALLDIEVLMLSALLEYNLASPHYQPAFFSRHSEQDRLLDGSLVPRFDRDGVARHGYRAHAAGSLARVAGVFMEAEDSAPIHEGWGRNQATFRAGGTLRAWRFANASVAWVHRGFSDYRDVFAASSSSMLVAEERISLWPIALSWRQWRTFQGPAQGNTPQVGTAFMVHLQAGI